MFLRRYFLSSSTLTLGVRSGQSPDQADVALAENSIVSICRVHGARVEKGWIVGGFRSAETVLDGGDSRTSISGLICSGDTRIVEDATCVELFGKSRRRVHFSSLTCPS